MEGGGEGAQRSAKVNYIDHKKTVQSASHNTRHGGEGGVGARGGYSHTKCVVSYFTSVLETCGVVRSGQVVGTGQWRHDAGSHSTRHTAGERGCRQYNRTWPYTTNTIP